MDGEVIVHLWEMEGAASLSRLNGIFAVAVASTQSGEVVLARDPLGLAGEYATRLARASAEADPFCAYMQLCTYSTALERARRLAATRPR